MLERPAGGFFGGLWVFPGGAVEESDHEDIVRRAVSLPSGEEDLPWRAAALRETVEEVGLAITRPPLHSTGWGRGRTVFEQVISRGAVLDGHRLRLLSQWVTPEWAPTRFDARFYLAVVDGDPTLVPQEDEVVSIEWVYPADALARLERQEWALVTPTVHHIRWMATYASVESMWRAATEPGVRRNLPAPEEDGSLVRVQLPVVSDRS